MCLGSELYSYLLDAYLFVCWIVETDISTMESAWDSPNFKCILFSFVSQTLHVGIEVFSPVSELVTFIIMRIWKVR